MPQIQTVKLQNIHEEVLKNVVRSDCGIFSPFLDSDEYDLPKLAVRSSSMDYMGCTNGITQKSKIPRPSLRPLSPNSTENSQTSRSSSLNPPSSVPAAIVITQPMKNSSSNFNGHSSFGSVSPRNPSPPLNNFPSHFHHNNPINMGFHPPLNCLTSSIRPAYPENTSQIPNLSSPRGIQKEMLIKDSISMTSPRSAVNEKGGMDSKFQTSAK